MDKRAIIFLAVGIIITTAILAWPRDDCPLPQQVADENWDTSGDGYLYFSKEYGWFQKKHFDAHHMIGKIRKATKSQARSEFTVSSIDVTGCFLETTYRVSSKIQEEHILGIALAIFMDYQSRWETHQENCPSASSSYSHEDLPSNMLAFIAEMQGKSTEELLNNLNAYKANRTLTNNFQISEQSLKAYSQKENLSLERILYSTEELPLEGVGWQIDFLPKRLNTKTCKYDIQEWPWEIPHRINQVGDQHLWCRISQREDYGNGEPKLYYFDNCPLK